MKFPGLFLVRALIVWGGLGTITGTYLALRAPGGHLPKPLVVLVLLIAGVLGAILFTLLWTAYLNVAPDRLKGRIIPDWVTMLLAGTLAGWIVVQFDFGVPNHLGAVFGLLASGLCELASLWVK